MTERLQDLLTRSVERDPGATALVLGDETMTYGELEAASNRLAHALVERGVRPGDRVGVLAAKTPATIAALIGVLRAGGAYVPVDSASPAARSCTWCRPRWASTPAGPPRSSATTS